MCLKDAFSKIKHRVRRVSCDGPFAVRKLLVRGGSACFSFVPLPEADAQKDPAKSDVRSSLLRFPSGSSVVSCLAIQS